MCVATESRSRGILEEHLDSAALLLAVLGQEATTRLREAHTAQGLKPRQFQLLALLLDREPTAQRELGLAMGVDPSVLVTLLNPLEERRLVARRRESHDRRRHVVTLTAAGRRRARQAAAAQQEAER